MDAERLGSWRVGPTRERLEAFLRAVDAVPVGDRLAVFDNDGTLWSERPRYTQVEFLVRELQLAVASRPELADRREYQAVLAGDEAVLDELGLIPVALALLELCRDMPPDDFERRVRGFMAEARHPERGVPFADTRYEPMLELLDLLRDLDFTIAVVTGGGVEFVRAVCQSFYGVDPAHVVGSLVGYRYTRTDGGARLLRTDGVAGEANEGPAKVVAIQRQLGRRPILAVGNSPGDTAMLEYAAATDGPSLAVLIDHDDAVREYAYRGRAETATADESVTTTAAREGWLVVSTRDDWSRIFAHSPRISGRMR